MVSTSRILVAVVQMCYGAKDWDALNENIMLLTKRRSQLKQVQHARMLVLLLENKSTVCILYLITFLFCPLYSSGCCQDGTGMLQVCGYYDRPDRQAQAH